MKQKRPRRTLDKVALRKMLAKKRDKSAAANLNSRAAEARELGHGAQLVHQMAVSVVSAQKRATTNNVPKLVKVRLNCNDNVSIL